MPAAVRLHGRWVDATAPVRTLLELLLPLLEGLDLQRNIAAVRKALLVLASVGDHLVVVRVVDAVLARVGRALSLEDGGDDLGWAVGTGSMTFSLRKGRSS